MSNIFETFLSFIMCVIFWIEYLFLDTFSFKLNYIKFTNSSVFRLTFISYWRCKILVMSQFQRKWREFQCSRSCCICWTPTYWTEIQVDGEAIFRVTIVKSFITIFEATLINQIASSLHDQKYTLFCHVSPPPSILAVVRLVYNYCIRLLTVERESFWVCHE